MKKIATTSKPSFASKNKDILIVGGVIVVLAGAAVTYYLMRKKKEKKTEKNADLDFISSANTSGGNTAFTPPFVPTKGSTGSSKPALSAGRIIVKMGSRGANVRILQRYLKIHKEDLGRTGPKRDGVDGIFGPKTARAAQRRLKKTAFTSADIAGMLKALKSLGK